jgi:hypothetical protein
MMARRRIRRETDRRLMAQHESRQDVALFDNLDERHHEIAGDAENLTGPWSFGATSQSKREKGVCGDPPGNKKTSHKSQPRAAVTLKVLPDAISVALGLHGANEEGQTVDRAIPTRIGDSLYCSRSIITFFLFCDEADRATQALVL